MLCGAGAAARTSSSGAFVCQMWEDEIVIVIKIRLTKN